MKQKTIVKREGAKVDSYSITFEDKTFKYSIQEPTFDQLSAALSESVGLSGKLNMSAGGKVIFELCCFEYDPEISNNVRLLMSVCLDLFDKYVLPIDSEIKKN